MTNICLGDEYLLPTKIFADKIFYPWVLYRMSFAIEEWKVIPQQKNIFESISIIEKFRGKENQPENIQYPKTRKF